jgi:hypothetical protein
MKKCPPPDLTYIRMDFTEDMNFERLRGYIESKNLDISILTLDPAWLGTGM